MGKSASSSAAAYYLPSSHVITFPFYNLDRIIIAHELIHSAYGGSSLLDKEEIKLLEKSFKKNKDISKTNNKYLKNISERIARKKQTDFYLESQGIKKYEEKFTKEHYKKLEELKNKKMLSAEVEELFDTTDEDGFIRIMNDIAYNNKKNGENNIEDQDFT